MRAPAARGLTRCRAAGRAQYHRSRSHRRPAHGQQEFTFFNGHYDAWFYLPVVATVTFNDEAEQFAVAAVLRPGNAPAARGARGILRRLFAKLRAACPTATLRVQLDGGFATPKLFTFLEREQVEYVVAMPGNARLRSGPALDGPRACPFEGQCGG